MKTNSYFRAGARWLAAGVGVAAAVYGVEPIGPTESVFRTETRAIATDPTAPDQIPSLVGVPFTGHHHDPMGDAGTCQARGRTPRSRGLARAPGVGLTDECRTRLRIRV